SAWATRSRTRPAPESWKSPGPTLCRLCQGSPRRVGSRRRTGRLFRSSQRPAAARRSGGGRRPTRRPSRPVPRLLTPRTAAGAREGERGGEAVRAEAGGAAACRDLARPAEGAALAPRRGAGFVRRGAQPVLHRRGHPPGEVVPVLLRAGGGVVGNEAGGLTRG